MTVILSGRILAVGWVDWCRGIHGVGSESGELWDVANSGLNAMVTYAAVNDMV
jgi:hypothetical protein